jgi:phage gp37-like protein
MFHYIVLNIIYVYVCARFVDIIICVLLVGRRQSISCENVLSNLIAVLFAIK